MKVFLIFIESIFIHLFKVHHFLKTNCENLVSAMNDRMLCEDSWKSQLTSLSEDKKKLPK